MLASAVADHALHLDNHLPGFERLAKKAGVGGNIDVCQFQLPGYQDDLDRRPALMHRMREFQTIHTARHLDIGDKQGDIRTRLEDCDSLKMLKEAAAHRQRTGSVVKEAAS